MHYSYKILGLLLLFISISTQAQKRKDYYPDGKLAFEGKYTYAWSEMERYEVENFSKDQERNLSRRRRSDIDEIDQYINLFPERQYEGTCKFYAPDGSLAFSGNYKHGIKEGKFILYYPSGKIKSIRYYEDGMAANTWEYWDEYGNPTALHSYRPIPETILSDIDREAYLSMLVNKNGNSASSKNRKGEKYVDSVYRSFFKSDKSTVYRTPITEGHSSRISVFRDYIEENVYHRTFKHGVFKTWELKQPKMEFSFEDNQPSGTWKLWENGKLVYEMTFVQHKVSAAKDYVHPDNDYSEERYRRKKYDDSLQAADNYTGRYASGDPDAIDPGMSGMGVVEAPPPSRVPNGTETFTSVEQMPEFPGGANAMNQFLQKNIRYPKEAVEAKIQGKVFLKFVVTEMGEITNVTVVRSVDRILDREALRVVKSMPKWKPGKQNGKSVRVYYTLPISFKMQ
ncbi:hypothetical protein DBR32_07375 [Taibaiella sp. KBW10]|uniref:energy transducer TonB n=1 Tax=Taibaiella sp. KBW10 TaxID=2153357 RepID=UPI000F5A9646|nr:energy transducer TonB [Taibaiella sp. KBW10]RQO31757.1 hypothetical protein DBR32_07375 [Taibaiella sp. KBW10]